MTNPTGSILLRRGPTSDRLAFTPLEGEIIYDIDLKKIFIGDGLTIGGRTVTSDIVIGGSGEILNIPNSSLENSTISGIELGDTLKPLAFGTGLTTTVYDGSAPVTVSVSSTSTNLINSIVARDENGDFSARQITASLIGNADTVTNGIYTSGSYNNPTWITQLAESKVLPSQNTHTGKVLATNGSTTSWVEPFPTQTGNSGKFLSTNGSIVGWVSASAVGLPSIVGNDNKVLTVSGTDVIWKEIQGGSSINTPNTIVTRDTSGNFSAGTITARLTGNVTGNLTGNVTGNLTGNVTGNVTGSLTGNASTVSNGVYTTNSYVNPSWIAQISISQGGTGATNKSDALTNLLPTGESIGYVLTTSGRGTYFWAAPAGGTTGTVGNTLVSTRKLFTTTADQVLFEGVNPYIPGSGQLRVYIDGVRQFPPEYIETSSTSFTLNIALPAGVKVLAEIDAYTGTEISASDIAFSPVGGISSTNVQLAITELDLEKAPIESPTFTGTVSGVTATMVGLGNVTDESKATMFSSPTFTGNPVFSSYASIKSLLEQATVTGSAPTSTTNFDTIAQGIQYYTSDSTTAFTLNVRGNGTTSLSSMLAVGQSISIGLMVTCSNTAHYLNAVNIDGATANIIIKWQGGATPAAGNASSIDVYTLTIVKTAATPAYTVLGTQTKFA